MSEALQHAAYNGIGNSNGFSSSLPTQTLLESQKTPRWKKLCLDRLEQIAERQFLKNIEFNDFYKMIKGELVYSDYGLPDLTKEIVKLRNEIDLPVHAKHYDFLGIIVNQIKGEYSQNKGKFSVDNTDPISQNEFIRTKSDQTREYTQKLFNLELEQKLLQKGININEQKQFNTPEEEQQYMQFLESEKAKLIDPQMIQKQLSKNWKTVAADWAEKTLEYDQSRFDMDEMNSQEIEDYLLTGRWFRHYHIGYDYYKPERWHPCQVFISEDLEIKFPQKGEYAGRIHWMSPSDIQNRWGEKLTDDIHRRLSGYFNNSNEYIGAQRGNGTSLEGMFKKNFGETHHIPFEGYYDYDLTLQMQDVFDTPFGQTVIEENGEQKKIPAWFSPMNRGAGFLGNANMASELRPDLDLRTDLLQVTEAYWRSYKKVGILNYMNPEGYADQVFTTDDLLKDFLTENEIDTLKKVTLEEVERNPQINTIAYTWIPEIRWGVKVKAGNSFLLEDLYIGGDALPYQIKGDSNVYDVELPIAGYIGDSTAKKLRPYIIKHNIVLNQIYSLLEKELGTFFLFDVHYLPSEYKNNGNTREALEQMYDLIQDLSIVPIDTSKQNMQGNQPAMNAFMTQSLDFTNQIVNRMNLATQFKLQALEQIGITQQRIGSPSEYSTAEGIKQGMTATMAQTEPIFSVMNTSSKRASLLHLTIAQYCQKNSKDYSFIYTKSDGEKAFIELSDPYFSLRQFGLVPVGNSKQKKELETLKQALLNNNTAGSDILDLALISTTDSITALIEHGRQNRIRQDEQATAQNEQQLALQKQQLDALAAEQQADRDHEILLQEMVNETKIEVEQLDSYGKLGNKQVTDLELYDRLDKTTQRALDNNFRQEEIIVKQEATSIKEQEAKARINAQAEDLKLRVAELQEKRANRLSQERISLTNKN